MSAVRRVTARMIQSRNQKSRIELESGARITLTSTRRGGTELDADELYQSPPVRSFVEQVRKTQKGPAQSD